MNRTLLPCAALIAVAALATPYSVRSSSPTTPSAASTPGALHCQVPCGIYGDKMRIDMLMEDAATIEKGMNTLNEMESDPGPGGVNRNQMVRWVMNKDDHAQAIQDTVAAYWLAQRIKVPGEDSDPDARAKYHRQLEHMHRITVAAMKCKQTTSVVHAEQLRQLALEFSATYFSEEDLAHIRSHHDAEHK